MKKRVFSIIIALALCLTLLPATVLAGDEQHTHCICGSADCSSHGSAQNWTGTATLPTQAGYYYLTEDVSIFETWIPANGTFLCLNGHSITYTGTTGAVIRLSNGQSFTLTDCHTGDDAGKVTGGKGHLTGSWTNGGAVYLTSGTFTMYNGNLTDNTATYGGAVYLNETYMQHAKFSLYGGSITGNTATYGGGVHIMAGTFEVAGSPVVTGNTATKNNTHNVYLSSGVISVGSEGLSEGAQIDVTPTAKTAPNDEPPEIVAVATGCAADDLQYFSYHSDLTYELQYDSTEEQVQLKLQPYTVTFNMNGHGTQLAPIQVLPNRKLTKPDDPTEAGYEFRRWYETYDFMDYFGWGDVRIKGDITLNARWVPEWKIDMTPQTYIYDGTVKAFEIKGNPTDFDYIWYYTYNEAEGKYVALQNDDPTEPGSYMVRLIRYYDDDYPNPETGYASGSYDERFYDALIIRTPIVTFDANGGTVESASLSTGTDGKLATLPTPTRSGYVFSGWFTAAEGGTQVTENTEFKADTTLYAQWTVDTYNVTLNTNGGIILEGNVTEYTYGVGAALPTKVIRSGYSFAGWYDNKACKGDPVTEISTTDIGDKIFYAAWTAIPVPTYPPMIADTDNGTVTVSPKAPRKGAAVTITPEPEAGYTVEQILVTDKNGNAVEVTDNGDGTYSFKQPAGKVTVTVTFRKEARRTFVDVPASAYYYDAVYWAVENGITNGTGDGTTFSPNDPCTRAQMVTFLWRAAGCPEPENLSSFTDVPADAYYAKAVAWAVENGITGGVGDNQFAPDAVCTRAQMAAFLCRMAGGKAVSSTISFTDVSADAYYAEAVQWAVENGITLGTGDGTTFSPDEDCTRGQMVTFLYRFFVK